MSHLKAPRRSLAVLKAKPRGGRRKTWQHVATYPQMLYQWTHRALTASVEVAPFFGLPSLTTEAVMFALRWFKASPVDKDKHIDTASRRASNIFKLKVSLEGAQLPGQDQRQRAVLIRFVWTSCKTARRLQAACYNSLCVFESLTRHNKAIAPGLQFPNRFCTRSYSFDLRRQRFRRTSFVAVYCV